MSTLKSNVWTQIGWTWRDHVETAPIIDSNRLVFRVELDHGPGETQAEAAWHAEEMSLGEGLSTTLHLDALQQPLFGDTLLFRFVRLRAVLVINRSPAGGLLLVGGAASDPWHAPFESAGDRIKVMPGGAVLLAAPREGWPVESGSTDLKLEASGGDVIYDVAVLGNTGAGSSSGS